MRSECSCFCWIDWEEFLIALVCVKYVLDASKCNRMFLALNVCNGWVAG